MSKITLPLAESGQAITAGSGNVVRIIVSTHSSGVIKLIDSPNGTSGRAIVNDFTLPSGAQVIEVGTEFYEGVYFQVLSGTVVAQIVYDKH